VTSSWSLFIQQFLGNLRFLKHCW